jgi:hypothetical protein
VLKEENKELRRQLELLKEDNNKLKKIKEEVETKSVIIFDEVDIYWQHPLTKLQLVNVIPNSTSKYLYYPLKYIIMPNSTDTIFY